MPPQLQSPQSAPDPRAELERLRKVKRLRELEAKASGQQPAQPSFLERQGQRMVSMGTPQAAAPSAPDLNAPNPITMAMRQSTAQVNSQFAAQKAEEERRRQERTIFNSASPGLAFRDTGSKGTVELNDDGGDFGKGMRILPIHAQRAAVGAAEAALNTPGDLAAVATVPYAMSFDPEMQGIMAGSEFGVGADTLLERIAGRVKSGGFDKMQQTLDNAPRFDFSAAKIPVPESEQSFTGALTEGFMQYLIARGAVGKFAPGGKLPTQLAKDVAATGLGFSGNTPRLADMLDPESMGFAADYIRWLKSQPGETGLVGRVKNMAEDATLNLIGMGIFRGAKASADAMSPQALTPTNAGGARLGPVSPPQPSVAPPVAPVAQAPIPQGPPRMAQAGPAGAGQQAGGGAPATLQATPRNVAPNISREEIAIARDTSKAVSRFMRGARIPSNVVNDYVGSLLSRYEPLKSDRYALAFFIEDDLPQYLQSRGYSPAEARNLAGDVAMKTNGWGRAAHSFNESGNSSRYTMQDTIHQLASTQKDELEATFKTVLGEQTLAGKSDEIKALMRRNGEEAYTNSISEANRVWRDKTATPEQAGAVAEMVMLMKTPAYRDLVPESWAIEATTTGRTLDDVIDAKIADDPIGTAHWLQSEIGEVARGAKNIDGTPNKTSNAYETRRKALLDRLETFPGYRGSRAQHGDLYGADDSVTFGDRFLSVAKSELATENMARDLAKLSPRQQEVAALSIRDALLNPLLRTSPEDAAARITQLQNEGTLKALVTVLGPERGNELRNAIANMRIENQRIARLNQQAGSNTHLNQQGAKDAIDNIRGPGNRLAHVAGNPAGWTVAGGLSIATGSPIPLALKAAGSVFDAVTTPGRKFQSRVTKGLYGLRQADEAASALPSPDAPPVIEPPAMGALGNKLKGPPKPRTPKPPPTPEEWMQRIETDKNELQRLLKQYDQIDRSHPDVDDLMRANLDKQRNARRRIADKTKKLEAARAGSATQPPTAAQATGQPATTAPRRPPEQSGFGGRPKPLPMDEASRMQRAREQGFDVDTPLYHGSPKNLQAMKAKADSGGTAGVYLTSDSKFAEMFAEGGAIYPVYSRGRIASIKNADDLNKIAAEYEKLTGVSAADAIQTIRSQSGKGELSWASRSAVEAAKRAGFDGVDLADSYGPSRLIFDPSNIRGKFAKFDPSETQSSKLLAGTGATPTGVGAAAGGVAGYVANPTDANRDGVIDDADRGLNAFGGLVGGGLAGAGANRLLGPRRGVSKAAPARRFRAPDQQTFAGVNAKTADKLALARAQNMEAEGASRDDIWDATGWFKGVDGKWRFEIDDSRSTFNEIGNGRDYLTHPDGMFKAYRDVPGMQDLDEVRVMRSGRPDEGAFMGSGTPIESLHIGKGSSDPRSIALHEYQHGIQAREGFARGGSMNDDLLPSDMAAHNHMQLAKRSQEILAMPHVIAAQKRLNELKATWQGRDNIPPDVVAELKAIQNMPEKRELARIKADATRQLRKAEDFGVRNLFTREQLFDGYKRLAGETEARNVQTRRDFTPEERRARRPWETQDVPDDQQIVRFGSGKAESRPKAGPQKLPAQSGFGGAPTKGRSGTASRMIAGGVVGGMAGTFAGEADAQSAETMGELERARKEREDVLAILADLQEQQKFFATATEKELQKRLDREGFDLGPTGADGTIGPRTREAINGRKAEIEKEAKAARERLASADSNLQKWEQQAAFEKTRPTDEQQAFRDYAPLLGGIAGALGAKTARLGGSGISKLTATNHIKKSNALLNNAPITPPKTAAQRAAVRAELDRRATRLNEFWQRGGSEKNVPFATKRDGSWEARPPKNVTPPAGLFPDKFIGRNVGAADVLIGGTGAIEAGLAWQNSEVIKEKLKSAIEVAKDKQTEANLARVQELEDQYAQAKAWMMLGAGVAAGTSIGVFTSKYASKRANVAKAEEELAILRRAIADLKKPSAASSKAAKPPSAPLPLASAPQAMLPAPASPPTPPLPPSRPRRRP